MATRKFKRYDEGGEVDPMEAANQGENLDTEAGPVATPTPAAQPKAKGITKEELAKSGLSLRDYMNKQQGLTRRGDSSPMAAGPGRAPTPPARKMVQETMADRAERYGDKRMAARAADTAAATAKASTADETARLRQRNMPASKFDASRVNPKTLLPAKGYAKGGSISSASSRADGIATKGKTRGIMVMCGGGMAKGKK
jgi:hypothetical protein